MRGGNSLRGLRSGVSGDGARLTGLCVVGVCGSLGSGWPCHGAWSSLWRVCVGTGVEGGGKSRIMGPSVAVCGGRVWAFVWGRESCVAGLLAGGGKRVLQGLAEPHVPEDSVDGMVPASEGLLGCFRVLEHALLCLWLLGMAQIQSAAAVVFERRLIHCDRRSMASPRW